LSNPDEDIMDDDHSRDISPDDAMNGDGDGDENRIRRKRGRGANSMFASEE